MTTTAWQEYIRKQNEAYNSIPEEYRKPKFDDSESTGYYMWQVSKGNANEERS